MLAPGDVADWQRDDPMFDALRDLPEFQACLPASGGGEPAED